MFVSVNAENIYTAWFNPQYFYVMYLYKVSHQMYFPTNSLLNTTHLTNTKSPICFVTQVQFSGSYYNKGATASLLVLMLQPSQLSYYGERDFDTYGDPLFITQSNFSVSLTNSREKYYSSVTLRELWLMIHSVWRKSVWTWILRNCDWHEVYEARY